MALDDRHEYWIDATIKAALATKPGVFVDGGANTGQTLMKLLSYEDGRAYVGFEPRSPRSGRRSPRA